MLIPEDFTKTGIINKPHGVKGELNIAFTAGWINEEEDYTFLFLEKEGYLIPYKVETLYVLSEDKGYVKFEDVENNEDAAILTGTSFFLPNALLNNIEEGNFDERLIGFKIYDQNDNYIGELLHFLDIPNNPVIEVKMRGNEVLLPFHESLIVNFNNENKSITLHIADGLLETRIDD